MLLTLENTEPKSLILFPLFQNDLRVDIQLSHLRILFREHRPI